MCRRPICVAILVLIECALWRPAWAQSALSTEFFRDRPFYEPLLAEPRPARTMLLVPGWSEEFPDSVKEGSRFAWQISLGDELPILTLSNQQSSGVTEKGRWVLASGSRCRFTSSKTSKTTPLLSSTPTIDSGS
jgi:hypothetical protein